jgi:hypothetical protein
MSAYSHFYRCHNCHRILSAEHFVPLRLNDSDLLCPDCIRGRTEAHLKDPDAVVVVLYLHCPEGSRPLLTDFNRTLVIEPDTYQSEPSGIGEHEFGTFTYDKRHWMFSKVATEPCVLASPYD